MPSRAMLFAGNLLYRHAFPLYRPLYHAFKRRQDAAEIAWLRALVKPGDVALDIGGNIGFYTQLLSDAVGPAGRVHAFEPDRDNFRHLQDAVRGRANVSANHLAVSDAPGELRLYRSSLMNVDHRTYPNARSTDSYAVPANSIDAYLGAQRRVDFIKIDIQGYELAAYRGMQQTLAANAALVIVTELYPHGLAEAGASPRDVLAFFRQLGFTVYRIRGAQLESVTDADLERYASFGELDSDNVLVTRRSPPPSLP